VRGLAYKIQSLYGMSNTSENEIKASLKIAKQRLKTNNISNSMDYYNDYRNDLNYNAMPIPNVEILDFTNQNNQSNRIKSVKNKNEDKSNSKNNSNSDNKSDNKNKYETEAKTKKQVFLPSIGSIISAYHNNIKYMVKILGENKFSYNNKIYKSLSAIANEITGTRWSGYAFFHLK
jgi:hypothetical protein